MQVLNERQARKAMLASVLTPGGTLTKNEAVKLDSGKYKHSVIGREIPPDVAARYRLVWARLGHDLDGAYYTLMAIK